MERQLSFHPFHDSCESVGMPSVALVSHGEKVGDACCDQRTSSADDPIAAGEIAENDEA